MWGRILIKGKNALKVGKKIVDGAYSKMIQRIKFTNNPNFLIMPNYYFTCNKLGKGKAFIF